MVQAISARTYGNWRRPATAGLMGLGSLGTGVMLGGLISMVLVIMAAGLAAGLVVFVALVGALASVAVKDVHETSLLERLTTRAAHKLAVDRGATLYRAGPLGQVPWGTCQLPGLAAALKVSEHTDAYGRRFVLVSAPATRTYSVVFAADPDGAALVDQDQIDVWVANWGQWLADLGDEPGVEAAAVTIETAPDTGHRLAKQVQRMIDPNAPVFARQALEDIVATYPAGSSNLQAWVSVTFSAVDMSGRRRGPEEMARDLAARLAGLTGTLTATGAGAVRPVAASELCEMVRIAYDPVTAPVVAEAHVAGAGTELSWTDIGPAAHDATWDAYHHDSGWSVTWQMSGAPRGAVQSGVLARLLAPHRDIDRKRVTLLYRPIDPARAAAIVEADRRAAQFIAASSHKPTARSLLDTRSAETTAAEEAAGAGLVNFGLLVTATVTSRDRLPEARAAVDTLGATARLRFRPCYGAQDSAFAAALPLGIVLPKHLSSAARLKDKL